MPALFDSLVNLSPKNHIKSYNFGIDEMLPLESFTFYKSLLEDDSLSFKNVVMELDFLQTGGNDNVFTWRGYYWLQPDTYVEYTQSLFSSKFDFMSKAFNFSVLNIKAAEKALNLSKFNEFVTYKKENSASVASAPAMSADGFSPLYSTKPFTADELQRISDVKNASSIAVSNYDKWSSEQINKAFVSDLTQIIELSHKKGIRLIFLVPCQWNVNQYRELFPVLNTIPHKDRILLFSCKDYAPLFAPENLFDESHVNHTGARLFTTYLSQEFKKIN